MKHYFLIAVLALFSCNSNPQDAESTTGEAKEVKCFIYPSIVDSLQVKDLYDSARWYIHTFYCDMLYQPKEDSLPQYYFGQLELRFSNLKVKGDTIEINYDFVDNTEYIILPSMMKTYRPLITGVGFSKKEKKKIYMESPSGFSTIMKGGTENRYENPMQPKVLSFIKRHWDKLDNCFRALAERKEISK